MKNSTTLSLLILMLFSCGGKKNDPVINSFSVEISDPVNSNFSAEGSQVQLLQSSNSLQVTATNSAGEIVVLQIPEYDGSGEYVMTNEKSEGDITSITYSSIIPISGEAYTYYNAEGSIMITESEGFISGTFDCDAIGFTDSDDLGNSSFVNGRFTIYY